MVRKKDDFTERLLSTFRVEADEHIRNITVGLIELEKGLESQVKAGIIETVFREAHSLKGAARAVSLGDIEVICQHLESVFSGLKRGEIVLDPPLFDILHRAVDVLTELMRSPKLGTASDPHSIQEIANELAAIAAGHLFEERPVSDLYEPPRIVSEIPNSRSTSSEMEPPVSETVEAFRQPQQPAYSDTIRISMEKMDSFLRQTEELLSLKLMADRYREEVFALNRLFGRWNKQWSGIYPTICEFRRRQEKREKKDHGKGPEEIQVAKLLEFGEMTHSWLKTLESSMNELSRTVEHGRHTTALMVDTLIGDVKKILMLPFSTLSETFPKLLRDLSREQGKEVKFSISGGEIEIDRSILEEMRIAFIHLLRNTIDHGIEKPAERIKKGKSPQGNVVVVVSRSEGNRIDILLSDDGMGMDFQALKEASRKRGIISPEEARSLTDRDILSLAFQSGITTSPIVTDISGRGLGLAIVREKIDKMGGQVSIEAPCGAAGTLIRITLPVTLATFRGVFVMAAGQTFVIPTANVERVLRVNGGEIRTVENREMILVNDVALPLVKLTDILELSSPKGNLPIFTALVLESQGRKFGFGVDEILNEQEGIVKNFGPPLSRIRNVDAATILASGKVVPILNVADLIKSAATFATRPARPLERTEMPEAEKKSVLVVEDSITSRMLLKNILETSGYRVVTAVDGIDAMTRLKIESFDAVVSDVDMPRMNGFNLTEKIRGDKKLADLPVVLVTALGSPKDKERGIDVGANAYIVKSSFDQSNLLETIRRLI